MKTTKTLFLFLFVFSVLNAQNTNLEPMETGIYEGTWESLKQYGEAPEWFQDAKFGIWAHWGPQCEPEAGDWYARNMYFSGSGQNKIHIAKYGNPSVFGFKDVINVWKADQWDPEKLMALYKRAGAQYFVALANHHDNMDLWDSKYQPWNSVNMGPKRDILAGWAQAAKNNGLPFGISIHASHSWTWYEIAQLYDGNLTLADGVGKWWEGYDPQDLYAQNHTPSSGYTNINQIHSQWDWGNGASQPSAAYCDKFYNRTIDAVNRYNPDLVYFDDTALPFCQINTTGLKIAAHIYNKSLKEKGNQQAVILGKVLDESQKECMVWDIERGIPNSTQVKHWQTCTCIGNWHYDISYYNNNTYKSASTVIRMLIDIVSKNGSLLLSIPIRGNGTLDDKEEAILKGITDWMDINKESIYDTKPWAVFGEGPTNAGALNAQGFNEGMNYTNKDIRYVIKKDTLYATVMGWPANGSVTLKNLGTAAPVYSGKVKSVELLGYGKVDITGRNKDGLTLKVPANKISDIAIVFKMTFDSIDFSDFSNLVSEVQENIISAKENMGDNTGQYQEAPILQLEGVYNSVKDITAGDGYEAILSAFKLLQSAFATFVASDRSSGLSIKAFPYIQNVTLKYLMEARNFSREPVTTTRFGKPKYWTVENFNIPNGGDGIKQGIDKYPGYNTLMLGVWNDATGNIGDAKLYRKVTLPAGQYFFGASFQTMYQTRNAYIFASKTVPTASNIDTTALAFYNITTGYDVSKGDGNDNDSIFGVKFTLNEDTELNLGWVADLTASSTNEFRIKEVVLLRLLQEKEAYIVEEATAANQSNGIVINMNGFAQVFNANYKMLTDTKGYLAGTTNTQIYVGEFNFENNKYNKVYVNTANSTAVDSTQKFDFYLDSEIQPVVSVPAIRTASSTNFIDSETQLPNISGVHKVSVRYRNHTSSIASVGFLYGDANSINHLTSDAYKVYSTEGNIVIEGLKSDNISVFSINGTMIDYKSNINEQIKIPVKAGLYIVKIQNGEKVNVSKVITL